MTTDQQNALLGACQAIAKHIPAYCQDSAKFYTITIPGGILLRFHAALAAAEKEPNDGESDYMRAIRTGVIPTIWPPICMTAEDLAHFRKSIRRP